MIITHTMLIPFKNILGTHQEALRTFIILSSSCHADDEDELIAFSIK